MMDQAQMLNPQNYTVWHPPENPPPPPPPNMYQQRPQLFTFCSTTTTNNNNWKPTKKPMNEFHFQSQNRLKFRRFHHQKKKFITPFAPRNTTSFIIRAKKSGGIASLVSPCPVTPAILPTPIFSPSREGLVDMAKEEWGVDGYGSMKGLIRLRSPRDYEEEEEDDNDGGGSSDDSDVEEVERRLDHDLSRFEMIYPSNGGGGSSSRVNDEDLKISMLEEENMSLKERLFFMERELQDLRRRVQCLENLDDGGSDADVCSEKSVGDGDWRLFFVVVSIVLMFLYISSSLV